MYPKNGCPFVHVVAQIYLDPESHLALGRALKPSAWQEGVLIGGSRLELSQSTHDGGRPSQSPVDSVDTPGYKMPLMHTTPEQRTQSFSQLEGRRLHARIVIQEEDHLIPLMVAVGARRKRTSHLLFIMKKDFRWNDPHSSFRFGIKRF